jgi:Selenocysteine lyase
MEKDVSALIYIDTVQYAPHGPIDVPLYGSPSHGKCQKVKTQDQIPEWVMGYNQCLSLISFSEFIQWH